MTIHIRNRHHSSTIDKMPVEIVETKGRGHPDTICDSLADEVASDLTNIYKQTVGKICHFNVDKALLRGGKSKPKFGGGEVLEPMEIYIAGRATSNFDGNSVDLKKIVENSCRKWIAENLRHVDFERHVRVHSLVRSGSEDLTDLFKRKEGISLSGDTSFGVGFAPLSHLEKLIHDLSRYITEPRFLKENPSLGEDIKIMGVRNGNHLELTVACALVDAHIRNISEYTERKNALTAKLASYLDEATNLSYRTHLNAGDDIGRGSVYLTVTGTSGECGDDGQVGRGNRINGLITPYRPMSLEAASGKNPVSHVGRIYNYWARDLSSEIVERFGVVACDCYVVSQIGSPVSEPQLIDLTVTLNPKEEFDREREESIRAFVSGYLRKIMDE